MGSPSQSWQAWVQRPAHPDSPDVRGAPWIRRAGREQFGAQDRSADTHPRNQPSPGPSTARALGFVNGPRHSPSIPPSQSRHRSGLRQSLQSSLDCEPIVPESKHRPEQKKPPDGVHRAAPRTPVTRRISRPERAGLTREPESAAVEPLPPSAAGYSELPRAIRRRYDRRPHRFRGQRSG